MLDIWASSRMTIIQYEDVIDFFEYIGMPIWIEHGFKKDKKITHHIVFGGKYKTEIKGIISRSEARDVALIKAFSILEENIHFVYGKIIIFRNSNIKGIIQYITIDNIEIKLESEEISTLYWKDRIKLILK